MFKRIIALSLNPALDVTLWVDHLNPNTENTVVEEGYEAAGKAVNVSRALHAYGVPCRSIVLAGKFNRDRFEGRLQQEGVNYRLVEVEGYTRENITILQSDGRATRLLRQGFAVPHEALEEVEKLLEQEVVENSLVIISGSLPKGISPRILRQICQKIVRSGGKIALDVTPLTDGDLEEIRPWAIKPNRAECCDFAGRDLQTSEEMIAYAQSLNARGVEHCLISLDREGLVYVGGEQVIRVEVPEVDVVSHVGAGDSCFAGFIAGMNQGFPLEKCVRTAAAMGTASCLREGAEPPTKIATANILLQLQSSVE